MKRTRLLAIAAAAIATLAVVFWWGAPLSAVLGFGNEHGRYLGYVEGETSLIAPPVAGRLVERPVQRGDHVKKGDRLFVIDPVVAEAEVDRAEAALAESKARYENLLTGKRPSEQEVTRAQRREAEAALVQARLDYKRQSELMQRGINARQAYEQAESQVRQLQARVASLSAQEEVNTLAARPDEIAAARATVGQNQANLEQARERLADQMPVAPEDALVENTFFNVGEWVPAGTPVVSLLPAFRIKLRFFIPQEDVARIRMGQAVSFTCDSCPPALEAHVIYVSPRAEYTPPVIYSQSARAKLVFLIEARPDPGQMPLSPGLPVTVAPLPR